MFWQRLATLFCSNPRKKNFDWIFFSKNKKIGIRWSCKKRERWEKRKSAEISGKPKAGFQSDSAIFAFQARHTQKNNCRNRYLHFFKVSFSASVFDDRWQFRKLSLKQERKFAFTEIFSKKFISQKIAFEQSWKISGLIFSCLPSKAT